MHDVTPVYGVGNKPFPLAATQVAPLGVVPCGVVVIVTCAAFRRFPEV
jgi:hypothetical protein